MQVLGLVCDSNPKKGVGFAMPLANYTLPDFLARCALFLLNSRDSRHDASDPGRLTRHMPSARMVFRAMLTDALFAWTLAC